MGKVADLCQFESFEAAKQRLADSYQAVLSALDGFGETGATREQIAKASGLKVSAVCARVKELFDAHWIEETGERIATGPHSSASLIRIKRVVGEFIQRELFV